MKLRKKFKLKKNGKAVYGFRRGIDLSPFGPLSYSKENASAQSSDYHKKIFVLISIGDLNDNKNTATIISALKNDY